jgi:predicted transcriptional regulator
MNQHELDLIERFISAFNALDFHLESALGADHGSPFRGLVDLYAKRNRWWKDAEQLRVFTSLRNVIVHDKVEPYEYVCVPTLHTVETIEAIRDRLLKPERVDPRFFRPVLTVDAGDSLAHVLKLMHERDIAHFPVYLGTTFSGLLSQNGIARYIAHHAAKSSEPLDFASVEVRYVLVREENRSNYFFATRGEPVEKIAFAFHENTFLEAVLITAHGQRHEKLLGIATRADVLELGY